MSNYIIALILVACVACFTVFNSVFITDICDDIQELLNENKAKEAVDLWNAKRSYIAIFVRDAEIDVVDAEAKGLESETPLEDAEAENAILKFASAVNEIKQSEKLSFQTIFYIDSFAKKVYY